MGSLAAHRADGARYGMVSDSLSRYRMRSGSASRDGYRLLADGALVIRRGHGSDRRVIQPAPRARWGIDSAGAPGALLYLACWSAGLLIGQGEDACSLFDLVQDERDPQLDPSIVANILFEALPLSLCQPSSNWPELWPAVEANIRRFLITLDAQAQTPGLFRRVSVVLERLILEQAHAHLPLTVGSNAWSARRGDGVHFGRAAQRDCRSALLRRRDAWRADRRRRSSSL